MRRGLATLLTALGAFLIVAGLMANFYAADQLMKTPIDSDTTTELSGTAQLSDGTALVPTPVLAWSITHGDTEVSTDEVAVFQDSSCLVKDEGDIDGCVSADDPENRLISASTDNFATNRVTALAVNDPELLPADATPHEGLINKWPFEAEKTTYPYWDDVVGAAVDAVYERSTTVDGLEVYVYQVTVEDAPIEITDDVPGVYNSDKQLYIAPVTGQIINQVDHQERVTDEGDPVLILDLAFTDEQVSSNADDASSKTRSLDIVTNVVPLVGLVVGIPMLLIGIGLSVMNRRRSDGSSESTTSTTSSTTATSA